ncbi:MAG: hypothetical protein CV088_09390 [Nitrospira sp. LK70]|nr:hypothetical protein [Nitrospira sp. LK70]
MSEPRRINIFLSSPTDVQPEREAAERVVARLGGIYAAYVELSLERWERRYYEASKGFQESIAEMKFFDLVIGILWKRIGSELPPDRFRRSDGRIFESGTVYELETAVAANHGSGRPTVYVFKSTGPVTYTAERVDEERAQKEALDRWWAKTFLDESGHYIAASNTFANTEDFETRVERCIVDWLEEKGHIPKGPVWDVAMQGSPYPGLVAYDSSRSPVYFGRQLAVSQAREELLATITREGALPALFVIGASGSGKSSLVRAGVLPQFTLPGVALGVDLWRIVIMVPSADSLATLATHLFTPEVLPELFSGAHFDSVRWAKMAAESPDAAADEIVWALNRAAEVAGEKAQAGRKLKAHLLLVVDQLETLFGTPNQNVFTKVLHALVSTRQVWLLSTLRSDRYQELQLDRELLALKRAGGTYDLPPPGLAEIADIVKGPARAAGLTFAERDGRSLAHVLIEAVPNADALPLLQMALAQLFKAREGVELTYAAYEAMGGIEGAIAAQANTVFSLIPSAAQRELQPLVHTLVQDVTRGAGDQVRFTSRTADRGTFETGSSRKQLVEKMVNGRLLVSDESNLRVAHEALLRRWDRALECLKRLADAELRKARFRMLAAIVAAVVFLIVGFAALHQTRIANQQEAEANAQHQAAQLHYAESLVSLGTSLGQSARWAEAKARYKEAHEVLNKLGTSTITADVGLWRAYLNAPPALNTLVGHEGKVSRVVFLPDSRHILSGGEDRILRQWDIATGRAVRTLPHSGAIIALAVSHDGRLAATATVDGEKSQLQFIDLTTGKMIPVILGDHRVYDLAFMPDGYTVLDNFLQFWDAHTGERRRQIEGSHKENVFTTNHNIAVSPNGRRAVTTGLGIVGPTIWDLEKGRVIHQIGTEQRASGQPRFSDDGQLFMAGSLGGEIRVWEVETGKLRTTLAGNSGNKGHFLSQGNDFIALSGGLDYSNALKLWIWDGSEASVAKFLTDHEAKVTDFDVSPDGRFAVSGDEGGGIKVWHISYDREFQILKKHPTGINDIVLSHDGRLALSASWDSTISLWDLATGHILGRYVSPTAKQDASSGSKSDLKGVQAVGFLPDEDSFVSANYEGDIRVWDLFNGQVLSSFIGHQKALNDLAISPDGTMVASASGDETVRLWNLQSGQPLRTFPHPTQVESVIFSTDGNSIFSGGYDGSLRQWELTSERATVFTPLDSAKTKNKSLESIAVFPDGRRILTGADTTLRLWDVPNAKEIRPLPDLGGRIDSIALFPDVRWTLAGGGRNDSVVIQDIGSGSEVGHLSVHFGKVQLHDHRRTITSVAISGDSGRVVSGDDSGLMLTWNLSRVATYRDFEPRLLAAREAAKNGMADPQSLATLGEWYAFRGVCSRAIEFLEKARRNGASVSALTLAQCHWGNDADAAIQELKTAADMNEIPKRYLPLYVGGVHRSQADNLVVLALQQERNPAAGLETVKSAIAMYEDLVRDNASPGLGPDLAIAYSVAARLHLLNHAPKETIVLASKGFEADPNNAINAVNLAHGYLFDNQFDRAQTTYKKYKDLKLTDGTGRSFTEAALADFVQFRAAGLVHPDFKKIEAMLGEKEASGVSPPKKK